MFPFTKASPSGYVKKVWFCDIRLARQKCSQLYWVYTQPHFFQGYKWFPKMYKIHKMKCIHQKWWRNKYMISLLLYNGKKTTTNMAVIEVQFGLPPETNKKRILTWLQKRNSFSSRRFWNVRVPCLNRFRDWKGGIVKPKESIWKAIAATLNVDFKTKVRNYKPCKIARSFPCEF